METLILAYSFGVITVALIGAVVMNVGLTKKVKKLTEFKNELQDESHSIWREIDITKENSHNELERSVIYLEKEIDNARDDFHRDIDSIYNELEKLESRIMTEIKALSSHFQDEVRQVDRKTEEITDNLHRKIDSRVDKLESRLKGNSGEVQMIND